MDTLTPFLEKALSRRGFLAGASSVAAATALAGCAGDGTVTVVTPVTPVAAITDPDILNFALNLEYLEAEFYLRAATGSGLSTTDAGTGAGAVTAPSSTQLTGLSSYQQNLLNELAYTEQQHVRFLRSALGSGAVARPALDLVNSFNTIATLAGLGSTFNAYASFDNFITAAGIFEDVGVTAYNGAAPLISTAGIQAGYLAAAAGIMAVEAYHGATVRAMLTANATTQGSTAYPYLGYFNAIQDKVISPLSGGYGTVDLTVPSTTIASVTASTVVPADSNALAFHRSTDQVLHIVYGTFSTTSGSTTLSAGVKSGGFFPDGMNGAITVTQS